MAKQESPLDLPLPTEGGSYIRNDQTGAITRADSTKPTEPAAAAVAPEKE